MQKKHFSDKEAIDYNVLELVTKKKTVSICKLQELVSWPADTLVALVVMKSLGRGDWVAVSVATLVESYTEGQMGSSGGEVWDASPVLHYSKNRTACEINCGKATTFTNIS